MKPSTVIRIFGCVNLLIAPLFIVISWASAHSLAKEFLSARLPIALLTFCLGAFTVWLVIASLAMLFGRRFSWAALVWNGVVFLAGFAVLAVMGVSEKTRHDGGFFAVVSVMLALAVFGGVQLFAAFRPRVREWVRSQGRFAVSLFHPAVFPIALVLALAGPAAVLYLHSQGILRPCFVSRIHASSEAKNHAANLVFDASPDTYWSPSTSAEGTGSTLTIEFPFSQDVAAVAFSSGASDRQREFASLNRIRSGVLKFSTGDEIPFDLEDKPAVQNVGVDVRGARWVSVTVLSVYQGASEKFLAVGAVAPLRKTPIFR